VASVQVLYWREIPSMVKATGPGDEATVRLPQRFQEAIDEAAMASGAGEQDAYLEGWRWGPAEERQGSPQEVAAAVAKELETAHRTLGVPDIFGRA
jgi:hypothetical protein